MATPNQRDVDGVSVDTDEEVRSKASHLEQSPEFQDRVLASLSMLQDGMQSIKSRVTSLEEKEAQSATPSPIPRGPGSSRDSTGRVQRSTRQSLLVSYPDPTHSNEEKGLVLFEQFLGFADLAQLMVS